ncbi:MAG: rhomboid family intramembrane serine protease [Aliidongia sp.]
MTNQSDGVADPPRHGTPRWTPDPNGFAAYLVKYLIVKERYHIGTVPEAGALQAEADIVLSRSDGMSLYITAIVDREANPDRRFSVDRQELEAIGAACAKYCGSVGRTKLPVVVNIIEIAAAPPSDADKARLAVYRKSSYAARFVPQAWVLSTGDRSVWSSAGFAGRLQTGRYRRLLRQPRLTDAELEASGAPAVQVGGRPVVTFGLLAVFALVFLTEQIFRLGGGSEGFFGPGVETLAALGGLQRPLVLDQGEWYRLLTPIFLHADLAHIALNSFALFLAGRALEPLIGRWWFLALFFIGGLSGSLTSLLLNPPEIVSVGASGAIMALLAAGYLCSFRLPWGAARNQAQMTMVSVLVPSLLPLATLQTGVHIDYAAHLGGAVSGGIAGLAMFRIWPLDQPLPRFRHLAAGLAIIGVASSGLSVALVAQHYAFWAAAGNLMTGEEVAAAEHPKAAAETNDLVQRHPDDPRAHFIRALTLLSTGDASGGEAELRTALAKNAALPGVFKPDLDLDLQGYLALALARQGKAAEARAAARAVCAAQSTEIEPMLRQSDLCP